MNSNASASAATSLAGDQRWQAVQHVLTSSTFAKAPRMSALLSFLMLRKLSGMEDTITEYAIGIEVFRRDARDYDTTIDPVVRVQMGRLRERLAQYYAGPGVAGTPRIAIPPGSYVPVVTVGECRVAGDVAATAAHLRLAPLRTLAQVGGAEVFVSGLEEELALRLFQRFPPRRAAPAEYRVEVSVRLEPGHARASIRLIDAGTEALVWLRQRDRRGALDMQLQEALAADICDELRDYFTAALPASDVMSSSFFSANWNCLPEDRR